MYLTLQIFANQLLDASLWSTKEKYEIQSNYYDSQGPILLYKSSRINYFQNPYEAQRSDKKHKATSMTDNKIGYESLWSTEEKYETQIWYYDSQRHILAFKYSWINYLMNHLMNHYEPQMSITKHKANRMTDN